MLFRSTVLSLPKGSAIETIPKRAASTGSQESCPCAKTGFVGQARTSVPARTNGNAILPGQDSAGPCYRHSPRDRQKKGRGGSARQMELRITSRQDRDPIDPSESAAQGREDFPFSSSPAVPARTFPGDRHLQPPSPAKPTAVTTTRATPFMPHSHRSLPP